MQCNSHVDFIHSLHWMNDAHVSSSVPKDLLFGTCMLLVTVSLTVCIGHKFLRRYVSHANQSLTNLMTDEMITHVDVFRSTQIGGAVRKHIPAF